MTFGELLGLCTWRRKVAHVQYGKTAKERFQIVYLMQLWKLCIDGYYDYA